MSDIAFDVYNAAKERIGEVRSITSLQWMEDYAGAGEVKLVCAATLNNLRLLTPGRLLRNPERPHLFAMVQTVEVEDNMERARMTVRAEMTVCRLAKRVLMYTAELSNAEAGMLRMVEENLRGLPIGVAAAKGLPQRYDGQISWGSVLDAVSKAAQRCSLGYRITVGNDGSETFEVYNGINRTNPEGPDYIGCLSDSAGILSGVTFRSEEEMACNVALVAGEGEGADRTVVEVDLSHGHPRKEVYVDASGVSSRYSTTEPDGSTTEHHLSPEEYEAVLRTHGVDAIVQSWAGVQLTAELRQSMLLFGRDYDLGDILPLSVEYYGLRAKVRLAQVTLIYEQTKTIKAVLEVVDE